MQQPRLDFADFAGQLAIAFGRAGLAAKLGRALLLLAEDFAQSRQVGFGRAQLLLGILAPRVEAGNARRFLEQLAPLDRLGSDDRADPALADQRGRMRARRCVGEQQRHVLLPHVLAVEPVGRARAALDPPGDLALAAGIVVARRAVDQDRHLGEIARRARRGAGEDDVFHAPAAKRLGRGFAHRPADRLEQVGLAAAVGADDPGQARLDAQFSGLDEALEAGELEPPDAQLCRPSRAPASRARRAPPGAAARALPRSPSSQAACRR